MVSLPQALLLIAASALAGAINSVAGGGTLLTFPALLATGQLSTVANATSTVALWPGQLSSLWGYKQEITQNARTIAPISGIGLLGGVGGALLFARTPVSTFDRLIPFLVLLATVLFMAQEPLSRWQKTRATTAGAAVPVPPSAPNQQAREGILHLTLPVGLFLLGIAVYGGYFGAGIGILTLAAFGLMGLTNIHQMNGIKAIFTLGINGVASAIFIQRGLVDWKIAGLMAVGSLFGGWAGAGIARRIGQKNVRRVVIAIGLLLTISLLIPRGG
ncbi:MAG: sulfite exporter TauE/SafE family protein [Cytophagales bacterium]|nr:sulfite exporter TauE/SafE family protein [Armatimonadota bacterium]